MRLILLAGLAFLTLSPAPARADQASERAAAIAACRTLIAQEAGVPDTSQAVRFNRVTQRPAAFELRFRVRGADGALRRAECAYDRRAGRVASIDAGQGPRTIAASH